jgi:putative Mn2+ efflux pump MntP
MLFADEEKEEARVARFAAASGAGLLVVGLSVSLDELAIGFVLGLAIGHRVGESVREGAERLAGVALIVLAGLFLLARFVQLPA